MVLRRYVSRYPPNQRSWTMDAFSRWDAQLPFLLSGYFFFAAFSALNNLFSVLRRISASCSESLCFSGWLCLCFFIWDSFCFHFFLQSIRPIYPVSLYLWTQVHNLPGGIPAEVATEVKDSLDKTGLFNANRSSAVQTLFRFLCFSTFKPCISTLLYHLRTIVQNSLLPVGR